jgi:glycoside/pentoside/hexuronide:cation symporter, GPH family
MQASPLPVPLVPAGDKLRLPEKLSYGCGDFASCLYWQTFMLYLTFYYTDVFGISALAAAALLGLSRSLDAFFDPIMGMIGDRTKTRWGKYRPYLLVLCVPFAIAGVLTFTTPGASMAIRLENGFGGMMRSGFGLMAGGFLGASHLLGSLHLSFLSEAFGSLGEKADALKGEVSGRLVWAVLTYNALMFLYTAINIPYTAMLGVLTSDSVERTSLSSIKYVGAFLGGNIIVSFFLLGCVKWLGGGDLAHGGDPARGWQLSFVIIGVAAIVLFLITFFNTRERVEPPRAQKSSIWRDLGDLFTNVPWLILLATTMTFILFVAARGSVTVHYFKYFVGSHTLTLPTWLPRRVAGTQQWDFDSLVSLYNGTGGIASLLGVMLIPFVVGRLGKKIAFVSIFIIAIACTASFYLLKPDQLGLIFVINILGSLTGGPLSALIFAMYADTADYSEWKKGRRATGLIFSASIFSQKQGWAIGAAVALGLMSSVGFQANVAQTPDSLRGLVMLMSVIPAAIGVVSILIVLFYPLTEAKMAVISADLQARRARETEGGIA